MSKEATVVKLTDTQLIALSGAAQRDDGVIVMPDRVRGQAATRLANALIDKGLAREVRAKSGMPITRRDEDARPYALVITKRGKSAIKIVEESAEANHPKSRRSDALMADAGHTARKEETHPPTKSVNLSGNTPRNGRLNATPVATTKAAINEQAQDAVVGSADRKAPRAGSRIADVIALLARSEGAGIDDIIAATGCLPHTTRAALTGLRKRGYAVARRKGPKDGGAVYQIEGSPRVEAT